MYLSLRYGKKKTIMADLSKFNIFLNFLIFKLII